jgi:DNA mismatch repair ATPase MutS
LAGVPDPVLERAANILELLEKNTDHNRSAIAEIPRRAVRNRRKNSDADDDPDIIQLELL